jgi:hypothetical protein
MAGNAAPLPTWQVLIKEHDARAGLPFKLVIRGTDFAPLVVWLGILGALYALFRTRLLAWLQSFSGVREPQGGRFVYDRGLGGRKVRTTGPCTKHLWPTPAARSPNNNVEIQTNEVRMRLCRCGSRTAPRRPSRGPARGRP